MNAVDHKPIPHQNLKVWHKYIKVWNINLNTTVKKNKEVEYTLQYIIPSRDIKITNFHLINRQYLQLWKITSIPCLLRASDFIWRSLTCDTCCYELGMSVNGPVHGWPQHVSKLHGAPICSVKEKQRSNPNLVTTNVVYFSFFSLFWIGTWKQCLGSTAHVLKLSCTSKSVSTAHPARTEVSD